MKKNMHTFFQKIYLFLAIVYSLCIPITISIVCVINLKTEFQSIWHTITFYISVLTVITFIIECISDKQNIKRFKSIKHILLFFSLFFICSIISTILSNNIELSFFGDSYRGNGLIQFVSYIGYALLGVSLDKNNRIKVLRLISFVSFTMAVLNIFFSNNLIDRIFPNYYHYSAIFYHFNHYAYYLVYTIIISIFLFFHDENKMLKLSDFIIYLTLIYMLVINDTFGCYLAVLSTIIFVFIYCLKKKIITKFLFIIIPFIFISLFTRVNNEYIIIKNFKKLFYDVGVINEEIKNNGTSNIEDSQIMYVGTNRGQLWVYGLTFVKEEPLFGYGLDNLGSKYAKYNIDTDMPHNLILGLSATIGIPGMLCYFISVILIIIKGLKIYKQNSHINNLFYFVIFGHIVSSMFGNTMYYVTPYYVIILGMGLFLNENISNR